MTLCICANVFQVLDILSLLLTDCLENETERQNHETITYMCLYMYQ